MRAQAFATAWGSEFVMIGEAGHINGYSGLGDWPEGLALLYSLRDSPIASRRRARQCAAWRSFDLRLGRLGAYLNG